MATIQGIYVALFGRPADPGGLAYWNGVTNNGSDLSKLIGQLTASQEYLDRFKGKTNAEIVTTIYQSLFGRAPDATGLDFFTKGLANGTLKLETLAINILDGAQGSDKSIIDNKTAAADLFTKSLDTQSEIDAYKGNGAADLGRAFLTKVTDDKTTIPSQTDVDKAVAGVVTPSGGQGPSEGGGGGGGDSSTPAPSVASYDSATKILAIAANASAAVAVSGNSLQISANGFSGTSATGVEKIVIGSGSVLHTAASALSGITNVSGTGTLDVTGVTLTKTAPGGVFEPNPSLDAIYGLTTAKFSVNGNEADTIKAIWDVLDDRYGVQGYNNNDTNKAFVELGMRYVNYLESGGTPFSDFTVKALNDRSQSMHDNLLGNLNKVSIESRNFPTDVKDALLALVPDAYETRPVYDGNKGSVGGAEHDGVRAFDYARHWSRPDYIDQNAKASVDASASTNGKLYVGGGNSANNFNVVRHEGEGIELALKAKVRGGADYQPTDPNGKGTIAYDHVNAGYQTVTWGDKKAADWSFDFSVATGLNTQNASKTLGDYKFKLSIDVDPSSGTSKWVVLDLKDNGGGSTPWVLSNGTVVINDDDGLNVKLSQNSVNIGFKAILDQIDTDPVAAGVQPYNFNGGNFDIKLEAFDTNNNLLAENHIRVNVDPLSPIV
ncbi:DUF4214 domain-containing protein [Rhizobium sp. YJ-22]|uniref:DUF4214 domain-containing protein n=1 Tax=Rhizobium sp. YJ-22 TaxID=3037556 RepID=UPI0024124205|nr:DUF4214 domain-containing protein [Rhizobium sp. YJ-22]MDG3580203.1 DUF4214 domain-containing protein [Rhizobium sp. YJ-22]